MSSLHALHNKSEAEEAFGKKSDMTNLRVYYLTEPTVKSQPDTISLQDEENIIFHILFPICFPQEVVLG